jgi:hypothetical protein
MGVAPVAPVRYVNSRVLLGPGVCIWPSCRLGRCSTLTDSHRRIATQPWPEVSWPDPTDHLERLEAEP